MNIGDIYRHYKGGFYTYIGTAIHTETNEDLAIYKNMRGEIFARPLDMFFQKIDSNGDIVERFKKIG